MGELTRPWSHYSKRKEEPHSLRAGAVGSLQDLEREFWCVDNVHTLGLGLGRTEVGSGRIPRVSGIGAVTGMAVTGVVLGGGGRRSS